MYKSRYDFVIYSFFQNRGDIFGFYENSELYLAKTKIKIKKSQFGIILFYKIMNIIFFPIKKSKKKEESIAHLRQMKRDVVYGHKMLDVSLIEWRKNNHPDNDSIGWSLCP